MFLIFWRGKYIGKKDYVHFIGITRPRNGTYAYHIEWRQWYRVSDKAFGIEASKVHADHIPKEMKMTALLLS